jgi:hypothetical protein
LIRHLVKRILSRDEHEKQQDVHAVVQARKNMHAKDISYEKPRLTAHVVASGMAVVL